MSLAAMPHDGVAPDEGESADRATKRILYVADRPETFAHLKEAMLASGPQWQVEHAPGGEAALVALEREAADVLIAEDEMAGVDGVTLLTRVRDRYPTTIRMIVSGTTKPGLAALVSHRFLTKPCNVPELAVLIRRSCALRTRTGEAEAFRKSMAATALPSRPGVYMELNQVLSDPKWEPEQVAAVVERDVVMSARVLQLANSAMFGLASTVTSVRDAVVYLGVDTIRSLALTAEAFGKLTPRNRESFSLDDFQTHAMLVARIAALIVPAGRTQQEAVTAALLHDIGKLVAVSDGTRRWAELTAQARLRQVPLHELENEKDGVTHADVGAYLLSLWGLPDGIVEAVAHHHNPSAVPGLGFDPVAAVHIANVLAHEAMPAAEGSAPHDALDEELVERLGLQARLDRWRAGAGELASVAAAAAAEGAANRR